MKLWMLTIVLLALTWTTNARASCESNDRISDANSGCLETKQWHKETGFWTITYYYKARNLCHDLGKLVAKVDIASANDRTLTFNYDDKDWQEGSSNNNVRSVSCCSDTSELCNRADMVTDHNCLIKWTDSDASYECATTEITATPSKSECLIRARCPKNNGGFQETSARGHFHYIYTLKNCDGHLKWRQC